MTRDAGCVGGPGLENWMSFAGSGPLPTKSLLIQPLVGRFFGDGWSIGYSGNIISNLEAKKSENFWTVPIGAQLGKVVRLGPLPVKFALNVQWMPVHPQNFGQVWSAGLFVQAVRPKLLRGYLNDPASLKWRWEP